MPDGPNHRLRRSLCIGYCLKCFGQQKIARKKGCRLPKCFVAGRAATAKIIVIHAGKIVMDQRIAVQHLNSRSKTFGSCCPAHPAYRRHSGSVPLGCVCRRPTSCTGRLGQTLGFLRQKLPTGFFQCGIHPIQVCPIVDLIVLHSDPPGGRSPHL